MDNTLNEETVRRIFEQLGFSVEQLQATLEKIRLAGNDSAKAYSAYTNGILKAKKEQDDFQKSMKQSSSVLNGFSNSINRVSRENDSLSADIVRLRNQVNSTTDSNEKARLMHEKAAKESAHFYMEAGKMFSDGVQIMAGGALKTLSNALNSAAQNMLSGQSGMSSANQLMQSGINVINSAAQGGAGALKSFGAATAGAGGKVGKLGIVASLAGGALSSLSSTLTEVAKSGMTLLYNQTNQVINGFTSMASAGALFTGDMKHISETIGKSGMTVEQFSRATTASKDALLKTGLGITDGSKKLIASMNAGGTTVRNGLYALGFSMEEQADLYAQTMANMAGPRGKLVASDDEVAKQTSEYARNLRLISDLTGKNIKDLQAEGAARTSDAAMQIEFMKMGAEQAAKAEQAFGALTATEAKGLKSSIIHGQNIDQDSAILEQQMPALKAKMNELRALYEKGELDANAVTRINAAYKDRIQDDVERQKHLAIATTSASGTLNSALADIAGGTRKALNPAALAKREQELIDAQKAGESGEKKGDTSPADLLKLQQDHAMTLQRLATDHLDKYTNILSTVLGGMTDAVKEFASVLNGTKSPTDVMKSVGDGIVSHLGEIVTVLGGLSVLGGGVGGIFKKISEKKQRKIAAEEHERTVVHAPTVPGAIHQPGHSGTSGKGGVAGVMSTVASGAAGGATGIISEIGEVAGKVGPEILGGGLAGIATGLKAFAFPQVLLGATILSGSIAVLAAGVAGSAWMLGKMLPTLAEGIKSFGEIEGGNLVDVGKGLGLLALGLGAFSATSVLTAVSGVFNKISDFLGVGVSSVIESMKAFSSSEIKADIVKTNAEAFVAFSNAMASYKGTGGPGVFASLSRSVGEFFSGGPPLEQMNKFGKTLLDKDGNIKANAEAFTSFSNALASYKGASGVDFSTALVMSNSFFSKGLPLHQLQEFANIKLESETITKNASAFVAFSNALAQFKGASGVDIGTAVTTAVSFLTKSPPLGLFQEFAKIELKSDVITRNATAFVEFSKALEQYKGSGSPGVFASLSRSVGEFFSGSPPLEQMKAFGKELLDKDGNIKANASAFTSFANAMASYKGTSSPGVFASLSRSVGEFFSGGPPFVQMKAFGKELLDKDGNIKANAEAFTAFSNALASYKGASGVDIGTALVMSTDFFSKGLPFKQLQDFAKIQLEADVVTRNANAFVSFSNALATYKGASGVDFSTAMLMSKDFFEKNPPFKQLQDFAKIDLDSDVITRNAEAFVSFSNALSSYKGASGVDFTTALVMSRKFFKDSPPLKQLEDFAAMSINPEKIETNTTAFVKFSNALAAFTGFGGGDGIITGALNNLKSLMSIDPFSYMQKFANMKFDNTDQLKTNTELFQKFAIALSTYAGAGSKFSEMKILLDEDANSVLKLDNRMKSLIDRFKGLHEQLSKLGSNFNVMFNKDGEARISAGTGTTSGGTVSTAPPATTTPTPVKPEVPTPKPEPKPATAGANAVAGGAVSKPSETVSGPVMSSSDMNKYLKSIALIESGGDANAKAPVGTASGMFQFINSTWKEYTKEMGKNYSLEDRFDPKKAAEVAEYFTIKQKNQMEKGLGRGVNNTDLYMGHFLGAGGATKFLKAKDTNPEQSAAALDRKAAEANRDIYFDKGRERSVQEVYALMDKKVKGAETALATGTWRKKGISSDVANITAGGPASQLAEAKTSKDKVDAANQVAANTKAANDIDKKTIQDKKSVAEQIKQATTFVGANGEAITGTQAKLLDSLMNGKKITDSQVTAMASLNDNEELVNDSKTRSVDLAKDSTTAEKEKNAAAEETALFARKYQTKITSDLITANNNTSKAFANMGAGIDPSMLTPNLQKQIDATNKSFAAMGTQINPSKITTDIKQTATVTSDVFNNMSKRIDTSDMILASVKKVESANESLAKVSDPIKLTTTMTDKVTRGFTNLFDPINDIGLPKLTPKPTDNIFLSKSKDKEKESFALMDKERKARTDSVNSIISASKEISEPLTGFKFSNGNLNQPFTAYTAPPIEFKSFTPKVNATTTAIADESVKKQAEEAKRMAEEKSKPDPMLTCLKELVSVQRDVANNTGAQVGIASEANDYHDRLSKAVKQLY